MSVVAIVPAKDREDSVAATVVALRELEQVDRVLVVDDGSVDDTAAVARAAGADVLRLDVNRGKGGAVAAGVAATPEADVYLLIDADLADTAAVADRLLTPVLDDEADLVVGVLPAAGRKGGFGTIRRVAAAGIRRACGAEVRAPLSGQRAVRAGLLRGLHDAERFGLEVAMTIDAVRSGARLLEVEVPMDHRHTGRTVAGFRHRGRQGADVVRALAPRLTTRRTRVGLIAITVVLALLGLLAAGRSAVPASEPLLAAPADRVLVIGVPHLELDDLDRLPTIAGLTRTGAAAAMSVRTLSSRPTVAEAYTSLGAGDRVRARAEGLDQAVPAEAPLEGSTAAETTARRTGRTPSGSIVVPSIASVVAGAGDDINSEPGTLGDALRAAGLDTGVVSNADEVAGDGDNVQHRPAALAVVDQAGGVGSGAVLADALIVPDPREPFGIRADTDAVVAATTAALSTAQVVVVDPGDTTRAVAYRTVASADASEFARRRALTRVDELVARLLDVVDDRTLVLVVGITPPTREWQLTPVVATGAGITPGTLHSPSTKRIGIVTLTDLAPTILSALGAEVPDELIGSPLRHRAAEVDLDELQRADELAGSREGIYYPMALTFIVVQALLYILVVAVLARGPGERLAPVLRIVVLVFAAWPLATFVERAMPGIERVGDARQALVWLIAGAIALLAATARRHPLAPLSWVCGLTVAVLVLDVATGARLQLSSILGYSPHTAARYTGFGNTAFAVLAACAVVAAALHVQYASRRREALLFAAGLFVVVLVADVWPTLGADVGGVLTMVPVFGLMLVVMTGRRLSWRTVALAAGATVAVLAVVTLVDLARPAEDRTHLGRFVSDVGDDGSFLTTIERKWSTNVRLLGRTIWTWMVPIAAAFMVYVLVIARGWQRLLPTGSPLRAGVLGTLTAGLVGWLVNDSGVVVSALVFVYIGPYLTLLALQPDDEPRLLPALPP
jgi:hypothetical protein